MDRPSEKERESGLIGRQTNKHRQTEKELEENAKERERQTDRQTDRQTERQTDRQTDIGSVASMHSYHQGHFKVQKNFN